MPAARLQTFRPSFAELRRARSIGHWTNAARPWCPFALGGTMYSSSPNRARQGRRLSIGKLGTEGEVEAHRLMGARCAAWSALSEESLEPPSPQTPYTAGAKVKVVAERGRLAGGW